MRENLGVIVSELVVGSGDQDIYGIGCYNPFLVIFFQFMNSSSMLKNSNAGSMRVLTRRTTLGTI